MPNTLDRPREGDTLEPTTTIVSYIVPSTTRRKLIGLLLLVPFAVVVAFWVRNVAYLIARGVNPLEAIANVVFVSVTRFSFWLVAYAAWCAARYFKERQSVWVADGTLFFKRVGPLPPAVVRKIKLPAGVEEPIRAVPHKRDKGDPDFRPGSLPRLTVQSASTTVLSLAPSLTFAEAETLAGRLNSLISGHPPQSRENSFVVEPSERDIALSRDWEVVADSPESPLSLRLVFAFVIGGAALVVALLPVLIVVSLVPAESLMTTGLLWLIFGPAIVAAGVFFAAHSYYRADRRRVWTLGPVLVMPMMSLLGSILASARLGWDQVRIEFALVAGMIALALFLGGLIGLRSNKRIQPTPGDFG